MLFFYSFFLSHAARYRLQLLMCGPHGEKFANRWRNIFCLKAARIVVQVRLGIDDHFVLRSEVTSVWPGRRVYVVKRSVSPALALSNCCARGDLDRGQLTDRASGTCYLQTYSLMSLYVCAERCL